MQVKIKKASEKDIPVITELAERTWNDHYPEIISQEQIDFMLKKMYSSESLSEQMKKLGHVFFLVDAGKGACGFISMSSEDNKSWNLHKFYILTEGQQKGLGTSVLKNIIAQLNPASIRLTVNRQNYKSINFYFKNGFVIEKVADFDIGHGYFMNDFVMLWKAK